MDSFDYVIVGAGSAGCVIADRLSAGGEHDVLLVEAGPPDRSPWIHLPLGLQIALRDERIEWRLPTEPEPGLGGRRVPCLRGRTLGGSSSMNGMIYIRGQPADYDAWADAGCTGWGWRDVLPSFLEMEDNRDLPSGPLHHQGGPLSVTSPPPTSVLCNAFIAAAREAGIATTADFNGVTQEGAGYYQHTLAKGRRWSAARAFLKPALQRTNLAVWTDTRTDRILFENRRASGLQVQRDGKTIPVQARREVIVCAGAIHSPQLLHCSGIGDAARLRDIGVPLIQHAPEVGRNLQDHMQAMLHYTLKDPLSLNSLYHSKTRIAAELLKYAGKRGRLAQAPIRAGLFCRSHPDEERPDLQFHLIEFSSDGMGVAPHRTPGVRMSVCVLRPRSRGEVMAQSAAMRDPPRILGNFLTDADDVARTLRGMKIGRELARRPPLAALIAREQAPGPDADGDDAVLEAAMRATAVTVYHPVGTCRMGSDATAVVDPSLRVRGVDGLRVADASIMPRLISGNTNAPAMMIGAKAAAMILNDR